jgi:hypothetical protein
MTPCAERFGAQQENRMAKHFGAQHIKNGYSAMGNALGRPVYSGVNTGKSIAESIAAERRRAARMAAAGKKK